MSVLNWASTSVNLAQFLVLYIETDKYPEICCIVMFFFMNQRYASLMKIIVNKNQVVNKLSSIFDSSDESLSKVL